MSAGGRGTAEMSAGGLGTSDRVIRTPFARSRRWLFLVLVGSTTLVAAVMMLDIVRASGLTVLELVILALFVPTFAWISIAFWHATIGFVLLLFRIDPLSLERRRAPREGRVVTTQEPTLRTRTALLMPARNEEPEGIMSGLESVLRSLSATGQIEAFDLHLLSDTDAERVEEEESAWRQLKRNSLDPSRLHYRRRSGNEGRKAGNIAAFLETDGNDYDFFVVLDADSVMAGETLVELVRTMEANPSVGLIQTVPIPHGQQTLFGRFLQFAGALYSPLLAAGQSFWQTDTANYWGHNAIVRARPFREHCGLPVLPGRPPLGGEILSHDFVEAALLRRAGWQCYLLSQFRGSYEEVPANALDYAQRDRRWAQGSLQHLKLLREPGIARLNRVHFGLGAMGYLSSVLWLLILLASTVYVLLPGMSAHQLGGALADSANWPLGSWRAFLPLLALTAIVLFAPKVLGLALGVIRERREFGGTLRFLVSGLLEAAFAVFVAPLMMFFHVQSVVGILAGKNVTWATQSRRAREIGWPEVVRGTAAVTILGGAWAGVTLLQSPLFFLWLTPIFAGLLLSGPLIRVSSRATWGERFRRMGLLLVPSETQPPRVLRELPEEARHQGGRRTETGEVGRSMYEAERALFDLRRGRPLLVTEASGSDEDQGLVLAAVESLDQPMLQRLRALGNGNLRLVVSAERARGLTRQSDTPDLGAAASIALDGESVEQIFQLAGGRAPAVLAGHRLRRGTKGEGAGMSLARLGRMLPAVVCIDAVPAGAPELSEALRTGAILRVSADQVTELVGSGESDFAVQLVSSAPVPLGEDENARFMLFREANGLLEHVAILIGDRHEWPDPVPARLHSACLTGDLFGSLRCDCGEQLRGSLRVFEASGGGVLLYLAQEGRGIGLGNKLRAYSLQQQGLDTVDADAVLGFEADERRYAAAVGILKHLKIDRVRLLTNNPEKVQALEKNGIQVVDRQPLHGTLNRHNLPYVRAKVQRAGHWLGDMLREAK